MPLFMGWILYCYFVLFSFWISSCCGRFSDAIVFVQVDAAQNFNLAASVLYRSGVWVRKDAAQRLSHLLFQFLAQYSQCASITLHQQKRRFPLVPKVHMVAHCALEMKLQSEQSIWVENPMQTTNQIQEDYIGRPARISRRVSIRSVHKSLMMRSLIVYQQELVRSDRDQRGMDGYSDLWFLGMIWR